MNLKHVQERGDAPRSVLADLLEKAEGKKGSELLEEWTIAKNVAITAFEGALAMVFCSSLADVLQGALTRYDTRPLEAHSFGSLTAKRSRRSLHFKSSSSPCRYTQKSRRKLRPS